MKPQHLKKRHNGQADTMQAAMSEQIMFDNLRDRIAMRAYELYLQRDCRQGGVRIGSMPRERSSHYRG